MAGLVIAASEVAVENVLIGLLVVALIAGFVWFVCRAVGKSDWGNPAAALIAIVGAILVLLAYL